MSKINDYLREKLTQNTDIEPSLKEFFLSPNEAVIYGAGNQARVVLDLCKFLHKKVMCIVTKEHNRTRIPFYDSLPIYTVDAFPKYMQKDSYDVIIAVHEKYNDEILQICHSRKFKNIFFSECWEQANVFLKSFFYEEYFTFHGAEMRYDERNRQYIEYTNDQCIYKLSWPQADKIFWNNIAGELHDIVLPSIFYDFAYLCEGPYELRDVYVRKGDVVFDLGANVGLFSGVAAARVGGGGKVYAFEPTPLTLEYLRENLSFYDNVMVCPYAVNDKKGKDHFHINNDFANNKALGKNSLLPVPGFIAVEVDTISLDAFVEEHHIERVDFIKADIEGAERLMLQGARNVLRRFAPKLSLCTYHLPDDPQVMEQLILEANPGYHVAHGRYKLYAHCTLH
jgi:FkbM family methyltransferase